jgi:hypothetical protein
MELDKDRPHEAGHMNASDLIKSLHNTLQAGGRPHTEIALANTSQGGTNQTRAEPARSSPAPLAASSRQGWRLR